MLRHRLTDAKIRGLRKVGVHADGAGLYLRLKPTGSRSWIFIWRRHGIRHEIGLGAYGQAVGTVSLAAARVKADEARAIVGRGGNPRLDMAERQAALSLPTIRQIADEYIEAMQSKWRGRQTLPAWKRFAGTYLTPIEKVPIDKVGKDEVLRVLRPLWSTKPETATKTRERLKIVLDHAKARDLRQGDNPAEWTGVLDQILPPAGKLVKGHHAAMPYADLPDFMRRLRAVETVTARCLEFLILTASRSAEAREATWAEIDFRAGIWTVPATRMKTGKEHRVPLVGRAAAVVAAMKGRAVGSLVFPGRIEKRPLSDVALAKLLDTLNANCTAHGFRSSFRDWAGEETSHQREIAEAALAHAVGDTVERAYRRGDALTKRRALMADWDAFCAVVKQSA